MKKLWLGLTTAVLIMGIGTAGAYAASSVDNNKSSDNESFFEQMLPFAKKMHPNLSDQQIKEMYNNCHNGTGTGTGTKGMMGNSQGRNSMMNF
ncbi:hypothetical protein D3C81_2038890 [compost metagenome]